MGFRFGFQLEELTEHQKEEIKELGLPSDGYNYLQHLRALGCGRTELPISDGPSQSVFIESDGFVAPEPERRIVSAKGLTVRSHAENEDEAENTMRSSTTRAFSRIVPEVKGTAMHEIRHVEELLSRFEGMLAEEGDLLDSFVLDATQTEQSPFLSTTAQCTNRQIAFPEDMSSDEDVCDTEGSTQGETKTKSVGRSRFSRGDMDSSASFSDRWKGTDPSDFEGRRGRTQPLQIIDESFENILEEYDEQEVGELDDEVRHTVRFLF